MTQPLKVSECWCDGTGGKNVAYNRVGYKFTAEYCSCETGQSLKKFERIQADEMFSEMQKNQVARIWERSGIPVRFKDFTFDTAPLGHGFHEMAPLAGGPDDSFFLWGEVGRGKTGLAVGLARFLVENGIVHDVKFVSVPDLLSELRDTYSDDTSELDIIHRYQQTELLIMDDCGAEQSKNTEWIQDRLYQIINHRHGEMKATIFTSNLSLEELGKKIGARNAWRIKEMCTVMEITGPNLRGN